MACLFCHLADNRIIHENALAIAIYDAFPVTAHHTLVIPRRHVDEYFGLTPEERLACHELLNRARLAIMEMDVTVKGFNMGMNCGAVAGQTIFHCHIHLIPRRQGDVAEPRGGVRHVIPGKGLY